MFRRVFGGSGAHTRHTCAPSVLQLDRIGRQCAHALPGGQLLCSVQLPGRILCISHPAACTKAHLPVHPQCAGSPAMFDLPTTLLRAPVHTQGAGDEGLVCHRGLTISACDFDMDSVLLHDLCGLVSYQVTSFARYKAAPEHYFDRVELLLAMCCVGLQGDLWPRLCDKRSTCRRLR